MSDDDSMAFSLGLNDPVSPVAKDDLMTPSANRAAALAEVSSQVPVLPAHVAVQANRSVEPAAAPPLPAPAPRPDFSAMTEEERKNSFLDNAENYVEGTAWLDGLAGQGTSLTEKEMELWEKKPKRRKRDQVSCKRR